MMVIVCIEFPSSVVSVLFESINSGPTAIDRLCSVNINISVSKDEPGKVRETSIITSDIEARFFLMSFIFFTVNELVLQV